MSPLYQLHMESPLQVIFHACCKKAKRASWRSTWKINCETRCPLRYMVSGRKFTSVFLCKEEHCGFFWNLSLWMLYIGRSRHPGSGSSPGPPRVSIEFLNVCGSEGDLALESQAHFLAVAEHRLVPARLAT